MRISFNWLKDYIGINEDVNEISKILTNIGLEVEGIEDFESVKGGMKGLVIGKVLTCKQHPNADKLSCTTVDIGEKNPLKIICGAPNVGVGQKVVVATQGTTLYMGDKSFTIKKTKLRGEPSEGMICAEDEIGIGTSHDGIIVLNDDVEVGTRAKDFFEINTDTVFEIGLTPNRIDGASHYGVARDLNAFFQQQKKSILKIPDISAFKVDNTNLPFKVSIENPNSCFRYAGVTISSVKVAPSPQWLQIRLKAIGLNPINNIVDITNFVLHELGQPLHAFDADKIAGKHIIAKNPPNGTFFTTLDEEKHELTEDDLMIYDEEKALAIGGVFGGLHSGITNETKSVFLESAYFNPVSVRKTAKRLGISTDSSFRFERGVDPEMTIIALKRAALLIKEIGKAQISSEIIDIYPNKVKPFNVTVSYKNIDRLIGKKIEKETIKNILKSLEIIIDSENNEGLKLIVPAYRVDVTREADVIEEILRIYGYNNIEITDTLHSSISHTPYPDRDKLVNIVSDLLSNNGFTEIMSNSLTPADYYSELKTYPSSQLVKILNPLSSELDSMRQTLLFGGLEAIAYNTNRQNSNLMLYEVGNCYFYNQNKKSQVPLDKYTEYQHISLFVTGNVLVPNWTTPEEQASFYILKAYIDLIFKRLGFIVDNVEVTNTKKDDIYIDGLNYSFNNKLLAEFGILKKSILNKVEIKVPVFYGELLWENIVEQTTKHEISYTPLPKFFEVRRDLSLLLDKSVKFEELKELAYKTEKKLLKRVNLFDVYEGNKIEKGKKSYAMSFVLQDENNTLNDKYIDKVMNNLMNIYKKELGAEIR